MLEYSTGIDESQDEAVLDLYQSVNWTAYTKDPKGLRRALANSDFVVVCRDAERIVGLARSISDDSAIHYLQDILVRPEYQGRGIGRELLNRCLDRFEHVRTHVILTDDEERQRRFYESLGFRNTKSLKKSVLNCYLKMRGIELE